MGYVFDHKDADDCERWTSRQKNQALLEIENRLMIDLLDPLPAASLVDIGCGIGARLTPFFDRRIDLTAIDPSPYMLDVAKRLWGNRVAWHRGIAEDLPFSDNQFTYACLNHTLEYVEDPRQAIQEACRVAKDRLFIGFFNRYAIMGMQRRVQGIFTATVYNRARFFSVWQLKRMLRDILGDVPIVWRTLGQFSSASRRAEQLAMVQHFPFGTYAAMVVTLRPRYKTRPLSLTCQQQAITGLYF